MGQETKLYSITILRTVLYGEIIWGVDKVHYKKFYGDPDVGREKGDIPKFLRCWLKYQSLIKVNSSAI